MSLVASYGFDLMNTDGLDLQWDLERLGGWGNFSSAVIPGFPSPRANSGPAGQSAFKWLNNLMATRFCGSGSTRIIGFHVRALYPGIVDTTLFAQNKFLELADATGPILSLELQVDGTIVVRRFGDGYTNTGTSVGQTLLPAFKTPGTWTGFLEFACYGLGGGTNFQIWLDDVKLLDAGCSTAGRVPDRFAIGNQNGTQFGENGQVYFGMNYDDVYCVDGNGAAPWNDRLGPVQIQSSLFNVPGVIQLLANGAATNLACYEYGPDLDATYTSGTNPAYDLYSLTGQACFGRILGLGLSATARAESGSPRIALTCQPDPFNLTQVQLGDFNLGPSYHCYQAMSDVSLKTGAFWNDRDLSAARFGIASDGSGILRCTQVFLEKIVSLRAVPYDCGLGNYAY